MERRISSATIRGWVSKTHSFLSQVAEFIEKISITLIHTTDFHFTNHPF